MTKLDAYEEVIERLEQGDCWIEAYRDWVVERGYEDDVFGQLLDLGIVEIKIEVDDYKLKEFKKTIEYMRELQDEVDDTIAYYRRDDDE